MPRTNLKLQWNFPFGHSTTLLATVSLVMSCSLSPHGLQGDTSTGAISHGVASGDVTSHSALIWFRSDGPAQGQVRIATIADWERFESGNAQQQSSLKTEQFASRKEHDFTVKVPVEVAEKVGVPVFVGVLVGMGVAE